MRMIFPSFCCSHLWIVLLWSSLTSRGVVSGALRGPEQLYEQQYQPPPSHLLEHSPQSPQERHLTSIADLQEKFQAAKEQYRAHLARDYGEGWRSELFFVTTKDGQQASLGREAFRYTLINSDVAWQRLVRKLTLKLLKAQGITDERTTDTSPTFVWATGGHSASAGHGNLFNESYTQVLDRFAAPVFEAVGIKFQARSYAMGGTASGIEMAACSAEVFGTDVDILAWDYGMCDGRNYIKAEMYTRRAGRRGAAVVLVNTGNDKWRQNVAEHATSVGQAALCMDETLVKQNEMKFPDCSVLSAADTQDLPPFVRNYRCGSAIEKGEPLCGAEKWTDTGTVACEKRKFRTSWHPGWKWHAYRGHIFTSFMLEVLEDALALLESPEAQGDLAVFQQQLAEAERQDLESLQNSQEFLHDGVKDEYVHDDVSLETLINAPSYCHTARLPAEIRYQGILTGRTDLADRNNYDGGMDLGNALVAPTSPDGIMPLVYDSSQRQTCDIPLQIDFKDFFFVSGRYLQYASLTVPTDAEIAVYGGPHQLQGLIMVCSAACGWNCPSETIPVLEGIVNHEVFMKVNGEPVFNATKIDDCVLLQRSNQSHTWEANDQGRFEVSAKVEPDNKYLRLSSIVVW